MDFSLSRAKYKGYRRRSTLWSPWATHGNSDPPPNVTQSRYSANTAELSCKGANCHESSVILWWFGITVARVCGPHSQAYGTDRPSPNALACHEIFCPLWA